MESDRRLRASRNLRALPRNGFSAHRFVSESSVTPARKASDAVSARGPFLYPLRAP